MAGSGAVSVVQAWLAGLIGLGALYIVASNPTGITAGFKAAQGFISGTENTAIKG
ncbi:MAG TPA: hypothetical protein VK586_22875 [Streptosporangiaceae bacterium]|jgi:hypothetical protein|nr:hypothetical protein [Streptosporangiaceae bacterium]